MASKQHNQAVYDFFLQKKTEDPDAYKKICDKYPVLTRDQIRSMREREVCAGLIGLAPSFISPSVASEYGIESAHEKTVDE